MCAENTQSKFTKPLVCLSCSVENRHNCTVPPASQCEDLRKYYRDVVIAQQMLHASKPVSGDTFVFQQDNAPAHPQLPRDHSAAATRDRPSDFIASDLWPTNNP